MKLDLRVEIPHDNLKVIMKNTSDSVSLFVALIQMLRPKMCVLAVMILLGWSIVPWASAQEAPADTAKLMKQRCPKPTELAFVFSFGYHGDNMPKDPAKFEGLLQKIKAEGFNVIHATYTPERVELCKKHGVKLMIDFLDVENHHVYKSAEKAKAVAEKVKGNDAVWGYNLWNDHTAGREQGRERDIMTVRRWDPTHPAYSGGCANDNTRVYTNADVMGYYDFHWERGIHLHFPHLLTFWEGSRQHDTYPYTWLSWRPAKYSDYYHRSLWSANTSLACGFKGIMWFLGSGFMDQNSLEWKAGKTHVLEVHKEIVPLGEELMKIGLPTAIYSTPITKTNENKPLAGGKTEMMPSGLEKHAFPSDFWIQPQGGEILMGVFKDDQKRDAIFIANHNSQAPQSVALKLGRAAKASVFNRKEGKWQDLPVTGGVLNLELGKAAGELVRFEG